MTAEYVLYGAAGWGSTLAEAMLTVCEAPFRFVDVEGFDAPGPARDKLIALNPMAQVPTLVLPGGEIMTESAAIALLLSETFPGAGLAPPAGSPDRPRFLRRLVWLSASVYSTFTYSDYPERWTSGDPAEMRHRVIDHRKRLWTSFEGELENTPWVLGETRSALDIFVAVMTHWRPGRIWFEAHTPKLAAIAARIDADPVLGTVMARNFPA